MTSGSGSRRAAITGWPAASQLSPAGANEVIAEI